jgi:hypothetical protein
MPAVDYELIVAALETRLEAVDGIGIVHGTRVFSTSSVDFKEKFWDSTRDRYCGWTISREDFSDVQLTDIENVRRHLFVFRGIMGMDEGQETEMDFQRLINDVAEAFRPQDSLDGLVELIEPIQGRAIYPSKAFAHNVHYCELTLVVQEKYDSQEV